MRDEEQVDFRVRYEACRSLSNCSLAVKQEHTEKFEIFPTLMCVCVCTHLCGMHLVGKSALRLNVTNRRRMCEDTGCDMAQPQHCQTPNRGRRNAGH